MCERTRIIPSTADALVCTTKWRPLSVPPNGGDRVARTAVSPRKRQNKEQLDRIMEICCNRASGKSRRTIVTRMKRGARGTWPKVKRLCLFTTACVVLSSIGAIWLERFPREVEDLLIETIFFYFSERVRCLYIFRAPVCSRDAISSRHMKRTFERCSRTLNKLSPPFCFLELNARVSLIIWDNDAELCTKLVISTSVPEMEGSRLSTNFPLTLSSRAFIVRCVLFFLEQLLAHLDLENLRFVYD